MQLRPIQLHPAHVVNSYRSQIAHTFHHKDVLGTQLPVYAPPLLEQSHQQQLHMLHIAILIPQVHVHQHIHVPISIVHVHFSQDAHHMQKQLIQIAKQFQLDASQMELIVSKSPLVVHSQNNYHV